MDTTAITKVEAGCEKLGWDLVDEMLALDFVARVCSELGLTEEAREIWLECLRQSNQFVD